MNLNIKVNIIAFLSLIKS